MKYWQITVSVPAKVMDDTQCDRLFTAVADAVADWEPKIRGGWDADVSATTVEIDDEETEG